MKDRILELLKGRNDALTAAEIAAGLSLRGSAKKPLEKWLHKMVMAGDIVRIRENRYSVGAPADLVTGDVTVVRSGNGFVSAQDGDIFVPQDELGTALPGDRVVVRVNPAKPGDPEQRRSGKVIEILDRTKRDIVGTLRSTSKFLYVVPMSQGYTKDFYVADARGAKVGDRVIVRFSGWENKHVSPEAEIIETLGREDNPSIDTISVIRNFGIRDEFPVAVIKEAETVARLVDKPGERLDLRDKFIFTVDPERAKDFDDALSVDKDEKGNTVLGVHIADVCHFVRRGSALDEEARTRGNSVYLPDKVVPMLPEQLSNGVCSLKPDVDRLAFTVFMTLDPSGKMIGRRFARTMIRSKLRLTYEQAMAALDAPTASRRRDCPLDPVVQNLLREVCSLAQRLRKRRFARHALELDVPSAEIMMGDDGMIKGVRIVENDLSHQMIEECMVLANEAVATELCDRGVVGIHRVHEPPREDKIMDLTVQLKGMGYKPGNLNERGNLARFLKSVEADPLVYHVKMAVLRSMNRAVYSAAPDGHYALAKKFYGHFTSPIRRYPDLVVHRQLASLLADTGRRYSQEEAVGISDACTRTEWIAQDAERDIIEIKKLRYLQNEVGQRPPVAHDAVVVSVMNFGLFVEVLDLQVQGLVHVSSISDRFVRHDRGLGTLNAGNESFGIGRKLKVYVTKVDFEKRKIDFGVVRE
jgi:ribonuclease R